MKHRILPGLLSTALTLSLCALPASALEAEDTRTLLQAYYVDEIPQEILNLDSTEAILEALNDPYTVYMSAEEYQAFLNQVDGETVVGIGVSIQNAVDDGVQILSILDNSPAQEAGLSAGDRILAVDGVTLTSGMDPSTLIRGEVGTSVTLTIRLHSTGEEKDFTLERKAVTIPIVTYDLVDGDVGYIACDSFGASTSDTVREALEEMGDSANLWVVDLRSNPGGTDTAVTLSLGWFEDGVMVYMMGRDGLAYYRGIRPDAPDLTDVPVVVLTSSWSASGAEMFAAAVRAHHIGIAIGQRTYGKGVAQTVLDEDSSNGTIAELFDGDCLKITTYRFYAPDGATNDTVGVLPTLLISQGNTEAAALLLRSNEPSIANGSLKLELAGFTFYIDESTARHADNRDAFTELLEALPPSAKLYRGSGGSTWTEVTPAALAEELGLDFESRMFSDVSDSPFADAINTLAVYGLVSGYEDGTFHPEETITRAEFASMVASALDLRVPEQNYFSDVAADAWYADGVNAMAAKGFFAGDGSAFRPDDTITYEEMVTVLSSVAAWASLDGYELSQENLSAGDWGNYYQFSDWAQTSARNLDELGALVGDQQPGDAGTRETAAGLLCALMEATHLIWS